MVLSPYASVFSSMIGGRHDAPAAAEARSVRRGRQRQSPATRHSWQRSLEQAQDDCGGLLKAGDRSGTALPDSNDSFGLIYLQRDTMGRQSAHGEPSSLRK